MKKIFLMMVLLTINIFSINTSRAETVNVDRHSNRGPIATLKVDQTLRDWSNYLTDISGVEVRLTKIEIVQTLNGYILVASGSGIKFSVSVTFDNSTGLYVMNSGPVTCTTKACAFTSGYKAGE